MAEALPIVCSLGASDLKQRLAEIVAIGERSLIDRESKDGRHLLRFRPDAGTRKRLEEVVSAEAECCPFLDLALEELDGDLVLSVSAPESGRPVADELAASFARSYPS